MANGLEELAAWANENFEPHVASQIMKLAVQHQQGYAQNMVTGKRPGNDILRPDLYPPTAMAPQPIAKPPRSKVGFEYMLEDYLMKQNEKLRARGKELLPIPPR